MTHAELLVSISHLARQAGKIILQVYATDFSAARKADASPVTQADRSAEAVILSGLVALTPGIPAVAEEAVAAGHVPDVSGGRFWLVDPLDGTKEFISRNGEFTVNIALIEQGVPVLGVVLAPAIGGSTGRLFAGGQGLGAWVEDADGRRRILCRAVPAEGLTVLASRSHGSKPDLDNFLVGRTVAQLKQAGSSLKLCVVAEGQADLYPRLSRTMEWDIAAGHAVLAAANGQVRRVDDGRVLTYGKPGFENPHFVASGVT